MQLSHPLAVVTPTLDGDVLMVLAGAEQEFTRGTIHSLVQGYSLSGVRKTLDRLCEQGLVIDERRGGVRTFRLNRSHLAANAVIELASLRDRFFDRLREGLSSLPETPTYAAIFGSAARGDMSTSSDIDLFVVRPHLVLPDLEVWNEALSSLAALASGWVGNDVRVFEMTESEVRERPDQPILVSIRNEGIRLMGAMSFWVAAHG